MFKATRLLSRSLVVASLVAVAAAVAGPGHARAAIGVPVSWSITLTSQGINYIPIAVVGTDFQGKITANGNEGGLCTGPVTGGVNRTNGGTELKIVLNGQCGGYIGILKGAMDINGGFGGFTSPNGTPAFGSWVATAPASSSASGGQLLHAN